MRRWIRSQGCCQLGSNSGTGPKLPVRLEAAEQEGVDSLPGWTSTPARRRVSAASPARSSVKSSGVSGGTCGSADRVVTVQLISVQTRAPKTAHTSQATLPLHAARDAQDRPLAATATPK